MKVFENIVKMVRKYLNVLSDLQKLPLCAARRGRLEDSNFTRDYFINNVELWKEFIG